MKIRWSVLFFMIPFFLPHGWAADGVFKDRVACIFPFSDLSGSDREREKTITEAVGMEFQAAGFMLIPQEQLQVPGYDGQSQAVISMARGYGADMAVSGFFTLDEERIVVSISCYDVLGEGMIGGFIRSWRFNLGFYNSLHDEIADLLSRIRFLKAPPQPVEITPSSGLREIQFTSSLEGMEVIIAGETKVGAVANGKLVLYTSGFEPGALLTVEKRKEGYHTAWQTVRAAEIVPLAPLHKKTEKAVEISSTIGQLIGLGGAVRMYLIPDSFFSCLSIYPYAQIPAAPGGSLVLHSDVGLLIGQYLFFPDDFPFRMGISTGIGGIFSLVLSPDIPPFTDFYLNILNMWTELNLPGISFFLRAELKYSLGIGNSALERNIIGWESLPLVTLGVLIK